MNGSTVTTLREVTRRASTRLSRRITPSEVIEWADSGAIDVERDDDQGDDDQGDYVWKISDVESIVRYVLTGVRASPTLHEIWNVRTKEIQRRWFAPGTRPNYNQQHPSWTGRVPAIREYSPRQRRGSVIFLTDGLD